MFFRRSTGKCQMKQKLKIANMVFLLSRKFKIEWKWNSIV